jgi:tetratricopeptide (TPR) repeat protein
MIRTVLTIACVAVVGLYVYLARPGGSEWSMLNPADAYYNLLVEGFREGHLSVKKEVPTGFAQLTDPYDPNANRPYRILPYALSDLSYYKGRFYLYFGVTPALLLFWPFLAVTGHYLLDRQVVTICCSVGFLTSVGLLYALWRRYFAQVNGAVVTACAVALGLATGVPTLLPQSDIYQVAISCGYMLVMLTLGALWYAMHEPKRKHRWLMAASLAYGLAVGARPSLLFGAVILLVPVAQAWRERRQVGALLTAATGPITLIGLGLLLYNARRFDNPFEFGWHYVLSGGPRRPLFDVRYLWFNFRVYFLALAGWSSRFPFVHQIAVPHLPAGYDSVGGSYGILTNIPVVWLALAVPLAWRGRMGQAWSVLRWFVVAVVLLFGMCVLPLGLYATATMRFEVDFLPALVLLTVIGILGLEHALADRPVRRRLARWGWGLLLGFSVVFNLLVSAEDWAFAGCALGTVLADGGHLSEGIQVLQKSLQIKPDYADGQEELGHALLLAGKTQEAMEHYEQALRSKPDNADAQNTLAVMLTRQGRLPEAIGHYEQALRVRPDFAGAHYNLGVALEQAGRIQEAIEHYEQAFYYKPDFVAAQKALARVRPVQ